MQVGNGGDDVAETATRLLGAHGIYKGEVDEMENENPSPRSTFNASESLSTVPLHLQQQALAIHQDGAPEVSTSCGILPGGHDLRLRFCSFR
jgi:hypothetical protein